MKVAVASDHRGIDLKEKVKALIDLLGHEPYDVGTNSEEAVDYPDFGLKAARAVRDGGADRAITICWTGNGMNIAANKVRGIRAGMALNSEMAYLTRLHNDANVITLSQKFTEQDQLEEIIRVFLETEFEGGRHVARVEKIKHAETD